MARSNDRDRATRRVPKDTGRRTKKKVCIFCKDRIGHVDYKDVSLLRKFVSDRGKIRSRRVSGNCQRHQRDVAVAIKTARELVLLPYTERTTTERPGGRGPGRGRGERSNEGRQPVGAEVVEVEVTEIDLLLDESVEEERVSAGMVGAQ